MLEVSKFIRYKMGRKAVQPHYKSSITDSNRELDDFFCEDQLLLLRKVDNTSVEEVRSVLIKLKNHTFNQTNKQMHNFLYR
jgi:hypothetical protein